MFQHSYRVGFQRKGLQNTLKMFHSCCISRHPTLSVFASKLTLKILPTSTLHKRCKQDGWIWEDKDIEAKVSEEFKEYMDRRYQENLTDKKSRLLWQSRKRGISENCLLFSTFYAKYLDDLSEKDLQDYDNLLNDYNNEWDIYYWMVKTREVPAAYQTNVMRMLQVHAENQNKEKRLVQPDLMYDCEEKVYK